MCLPLEVSLGGAGGQGGSASSGAGGEAGSSEGGQGGAAGASGAAGAGGEGECSTNQECIEKIGGQVLCRGGKCLPLTTPDCFKTIGSVTDNPDQIIGVMLPLTGIPYQLLLGNSGFSTLSVAYKEFQNNRGVVPGLSTPIFVVCDETKNAEAVASHLIDTLGAKVIIGPAQSKATQTVLPKILQSGSIVLLPFNDDPGLEDTPDTKGQVWSCKPNRSSIVGYWKNAFLEVEKLVKKKIPATDPLRVAVMVAGDPSSQALAKRALPKTEFNGKPLETNTAEKNYFRIDYDNEETTKISHSSLASKLITHPSGIVPNLVVLISGNNDPGGLIPAIESAWPTGGAPKPQYLIVGSGEVVIESVVSVLPDAVSRLYSIDYQKDQATFKAYDRFRASYQNLSEGGSPRADMEYLYDCFWVNQYAVYAATSKGKQPVNTLDGATFSSKGIGVLNGPGAPYSVGGDEEPAMLSALSAGADPDLLGASSSLEFDLGKGTPRANGRLLCVKDLKIINSGLEFDPITGAVSGTNTCP